MRKKQKKDKKKVLDFDNDIIIKPEIFYSDNEIKEAFNLAYSKQNSPFELNINFGGKSLTLKKRLAQTRKGMNRHWAIDCGNFWIYDERIIIEVINF